MGALHAGHLSLVAMAAADGLLPVVSIFVNPIQFNQSADLDAYPIRTDEDIALLKAAGCHALFLPTADVMYPHKVQLTLDFQHLDSVLEGAHRPGHFSGVGVVVARLFHLIAPQRAYFGQKDLQQLAVVRCLVQDLGFPVEIVSCPTTREPDGLAMSSRNLRLSPAARAIAPQIYQHLQAAWQAATTTDIAQALVDCRAALARQSAFTVEYVEAVHPDTFQVLSQEQGTPSGPFAIALAVHVEGVRLLDNMVRWE
jgi:pantoate--beta-alanine ligase